MCDIIVLDMALGWDMTFEIPSQHLAILHLVNVFPFLDARLSQVHLLESLLVWYPQGFSKLSLSFEVPLGSLGFLRVL